METYRKVRAIRKHVDKYAFTLHNIKHFHIADSDVSIEPHYLSTNLSFYYCSFKNFAPVAFSVYSKCLLVDNIGRYINWPIKFTIVF